MIIDLKSNINKLNQVLLNFLAQVKILGYPSLHYTCTYIENILFHVETWPRRDCYCPKKILF